MKLTEFTGLHYFTMDVGAIDEDNLTEGIIAFIELFNMDSDTFDLFRAKLFSPTQIANDELVIQFYETTDLFSEEEYMTALVHKTERAKVV